MKRALLFMLALCLCLLALADVQAAPPSIFIDRLSDSDCWPGCWRVVSHQNTTSHLIHFETLNAVTGAPEPYGAIMDVELNTTPELGYNIHISATPGSIEMYPWAWCDRQGESRVTLRMGITGYEYPSEAVRGAGLDCVGGAARGVDLVWEWTPPSIFLPMVSSR
jgi:hypothetical protein